MPPRDTRARGPRDPHHPHDWHMWPPEDPHQRSAPLWMSRCRRCDDRVAAFRATAIYQHGDDPDRTPHRIAPNDWPIYATCTPTQPGTAEPARQYEPSTIRHRRALKPVHPTNQVSQLITRLMETKGWSKQRMADELDTDVRQLHRWLDGVQPSGYATLRLARLALLTREPAVIRPLMRRQSAT